MSEPLLILTWRSTRPLELTWRGFTPDLAFNWEALNNQAEPIATIIGPPGPRGENGNEVDPYRHTQSSPATEWVVNHNLGFNPTIAVLSVGGWEVVGDIVHMSVNQTRVYFSQPVAGVAIAR